MVAKPHTQPLSRPTLPTLAEWLLAHAAGPRPEDLARTLVLLPSHRAAGQLGHALMDAAGGQPLLLPWITTPARLADELADLLGLDDGGLVADELRSLVLAPQLARQPWLQDRPEAADGLAAELVALFDDVRLAGRTGPVLDGRDDDHLLSLAESGGEAVLQSDLRRIRESWRLYRSLVPRDVVDRRLEALAAACRRWPGSPPPLTVAAHLGRLDRSVAELLTTLPDVHWLAPGADSPRSRLLLSTYRESDGPLHPLGEAARLAEAITGTALPDAGVLADDLPGRLSRLADGLAQLQPGAAVTLTACRDAEHEARVVAATVCRTLETSDTVPDIVVASPDRNLAARIGAVLRDAGVDVDDTAGRPLVNLPAGRLLRDLLRLVVGGWPFGLVFEVLTHPYVRLVERDQRPGHAVLVQLLEAAVRRHGGARGGAAVLSTIAAGEDERRQDAVVSAFVQRLSAALAPTTRATDWPRLLAALRQAWNAVAPDRPLDGDDPTRGDHDDIGAVDRLLADLDAAASLLEPAPLADMAAALGQRLREVEVRPRRQRNLPVRVMGLVEARLEHADLLVLAGLSQDAFPGRLPRPLFLPDRVRRGMGLPHWRQKAGRDAELFLRLLDGAERVAISWPSSAEGQDSLPSPLVQRLILVAPDAVTQATEPMTYRRHAVPVDAMVTAERRHRAEPEPVPAPRVPPPDQLSHTALQSYRDCPYQFLLARAQRLRRTDDLEAEFSALDLGVLAHGVMERWLDPSGQGARALVAGDARAAAAALDQAMATVAVGEDDLPGAAVARRSLAAAASDLVAHELERCRTWRPAAVEADFRLTLGQVHGWLAARGTEAPEPPSGRDEFELVGTIDRVDVASDGTPRAAVVDYKTGQVPARSRVSQGRELQLVMYALAVEAGEVAGLPAPPAGADGWQLDEGGFYSLKRKEPGFQARLDAGDDFTRGVGVIYRQALEILDPDHPFALVPDWQADEAGGQLPCRLCEFRGICRLEERSNTPQLQARLAALLSAGPRSLS